MRRGSVLICVVMLVVVGILPFHSVAFSIGSMKETLRTVSPIPLNERNLVESSFPHRLQIWNFQPAPQGLYIHNRTICFFPFCLIVGDIQLWLYCDWEISGADILLDEKTFASFSYHPSHWYNATWVNEDPHFRFYLHTISFEIHELDGATLSTGFPFLRLL